MPAFRADFRDPTANSGGDRTGWLGRQDSNLGIPKVYLFELSNEFAAL
jgi:hypothetical protein